MFESLKEFNNIVISGPQRSGTRIVAKIVAEGTGKEYIDEKYINFHDMRLLLWYLSKGNKVVQCPGLCHLLHNIDAESTLIVIVRRPLEEILNSESRSWNRNSENIELAKYGYTSGIISQIKYHFWDSLQKITLGEKAREINYHSLKKHPLFITDRKDFRWDQTE